MRLLAALAVLLLAGPVAALPYSHSGTFTDGGSDEGVTLDTFGGNFFPLDRGVLSLSFTTSRPLTTETLAFYAFRLTGIVDVDTTTGDIVASDSRADPVFFTTFDPVGAGSLRLVLRPNTVGPPQAGGFPDTVVEYRGYDAFIVFDATLAAGDAPVDYTFNVDKVGDVPEPATWALFAVGFGGTGALVRRRRVTA